MIPKKYYKYADDGLILDGVTYVESEEDYALRSITVGVNEVAASNIKHTQGEFVLPEGLLGFEDVEEVMATSREEFEEVWGQHLERNRNFWEAVKSEHPIGSSVKGAILIFYPQGVIVDLGNGAMAIADYDQCRASAANWKCLYPRHVVRATVGGYDEENQWIRLDNPQVFEEIAPS